MIAPTRHPLAPSRPARSRPAPIVDSVPAERPVASGECTPRQKRWAMVAAAAVTLLALARPGPASEPDGSDTGARSPVAETPMP